MPVFRKYEQLSTMIFLFKRNKMSLVGGAIVLFFILGAVLAPVIAPYDPEFMDISDAFAPPSRAHPLGTNDMGMDILSRILHGARVDLTIAFFGVLGAVMVGVTIGAVCGYYGGWFDMVVMRFLDSQQAFPTILLAVAIATALGPQVRNVIIVLAIVNYPMYARLVRAQVLSLKSSQYVMAARAVGNSGSRIIFRHLLPNCLGPVYVQGSLNAGWAVLMAASLSFLGVGVQVPKAEWGLDISRGAHQVVAGVWWPALFPGIAILLIVLGFNLLGDGLQDVFDPKRQ
jgi:peptide/nickel transport system permease protein